MFVAFVSPVSHRHSPVFSFLIDGYLVISMSFTFGAVGSHFLRDFHTDHRNFATSGRGLFIVDGIRPVFHGSGDASDFDFLCYALLD